MSTRPRPCCAPLAPRRRPFDLVLGPVDTFLPDNPVAYLARQRRRRRRCARLRDARLHAAPRTRADVAVRPARHRRRRHRARARSPPRRPCWLPTGESRGRRGPLCSRSRGRRLDADRRLSAGPAGGHRPRRSARSSSTYRRATTRWSRSPHVATGDVVGRATAWRREPAAWLVGARGGRGIAAGRHRVPPARRGPVVGGTAGAETIEVAPDGSTARRVPEARGWRAGRARPSRRL